MTRDWLSVHEGSAPLVIGLPHTGTDIPAAIEARMTSSWLARKDADWWVDRLYDFATEIGATTVRTGVSRSATRADAAGIAAARTASRAAITGLIVVA